MNIFRLEIYDHLSFPVSLLNDILNGIYNIPLWGAFTNFKIIKSTEFSWNVIDNFSFLAVGYRTQTSAKKPMD